MRIKLVLTVDYDPNGVNDAELRRQLDSMIARAVGNGELTGESAAIVDTWHVEIVTVTA